jgi:hypothetical protein
LQSLPILMILIDLVRVAALRLLNIEIVYIEAFVHSILQGKVSQDALGDSVIFLLDGYFERSTFLNIFCR